MNMTALLSDWYPLGQGSHAKSEFDMLEVSRNPLRLMTSLPESDTPKIYFVHLMQGNVPKCALVALQSIQTKSDSECHMLMLIVKFNSAHTCTAQHRSKKSRTEHDKTRVLFVSVSPSTTTQCSACIFENHSSQQGSACLCLAWMSEALG